MGNFIELRGSDDIELIGKTTEHPENHFGKPELISALQELAAAYRQAFKNGEFDTWRRIHKNPKEDNKSFFILEKLVKDIPEVTNPLRIRSVVQKLQVNDMSLVNGGRFDCRPKDTNGKKGKPFQPPHETHMFGEDADVDYKHQNYLQRIWLEQNASQYGFKCRLEDEGTDNVHWHLDLM